MSPPFRTIFDQTYTTMLTDLFCATMTSSSFHQFHKFIPFNFAIAQNFQHQTRANNFTPMNGNNRAPDVRMTQKMVTSFDSQNFKSHPLQSGNNLLPREPR